MKNTNLHPRDIEALSAFLDDQLTNQEAERLQVRLEREPALQDALEGLRQTRHALRLTPQVRAPRNFTLTPEMAGAGSRRWFSFARISFGLASLLLVLSLAGNFAFPPGLAEQAFSAEPAAMVQQESALDTASGEGSDEMQAESMVVEEPAEAEMMEESSGAAGSTGPVEELEQEAQSITTTRGMTSTGLVAPEALEEGDGDATLAQIEEVPVPKESAGDEESGPVNYWLYAAGLFGLVMLVSGVAMLILRR